MYYLGSSGGGEHVPGPFWERNNQQHERTISEAGKPQLVPLNREYHSLDGAAHVPTSSHTYSLVIPWFA